MGLLCESDAGARFQTFRRRRIRAAHGLSEPWPAPRLRALPLGPVPRTWTDRILAVGDAAGLVKPTTGGGIYYGLLTGHLAADVLAEALRDDRLGASRLQGDTSAAGARASARKSAPASRSAPSRPG